jgi:hypothetical protein
METLVWDAQSGVSAVSREQGLILVCKSPARLRDAPVEWSRQHAMLGLSFWLASSRGIMPATLSRSRHLSTRVRTSNPATPLRTRLLPAALALRQEQVCRRQRPESGVRKRAASLSVLANRDRLPFTTPSNRRRNSGPSAQCYGHAEYDGLRGGPVRTALL